MVTNKLKKLATTLGKSRSFKEDLLNAGYSETTANQQISVTRTQGFKELLATMLPVTDAFQATKDGLKATKLEGLGNLVPDHNIRLKSAEQTYKLHGVISQDSSSTSHSTVINVLNYGDGDIVGKK